MCLVHILKTVDKISLKINPSYLNSRLNVGKVWIIENFANLVANFFFKKVKLYYILCNLMHIYKVGLYWIQIRLLFHTVNLILSYYHFNQIFYPLLTYFVASKTFIRCFWRRKGIMYWGFVLTLKNNFVTPRWYYMFW